MTQTARFIALGILITLSVGCTTQSRLMYAAKHGRLDMAEKALLRGASASAADRKGNTPLHALATRDMSSLMLSMKDGDWLNPLNYTKLGHAGDDIILFSTLIKNGANVNAPNNDGDTPLHTAAMNNSPHVAMLLLAQGADPMARDKIGRTPLELAARAGYRDFLEILRREQHHTPNLRTDDIDQYLNNWQDYAPREGTPEVQREGSQY